MNSALPSWAIDLIRYGPSPGDLRERGYGAVIAALVRTAMSAHRRGVDKDIWLDLVYSPTSRLGVAMRTKDGRTRTAHALGKEVDRAWDRAWLKCSEEGAWSTAQAAEEAARRADFLLDIVAGADVDLIDTDRRVLAHVAELARKRGSTRVALARRTAAAATGLGVQAVRLSLARLEARGLLELVEHGRPSGPKSKSPARANVYGLPEAGSLYMGGVPPQVGSPATHVGSPDTAAMGSPATHVGSSQQQIDAELKRARRAVREQIEPGGESATFTGSRAAMARLRRLVEEAGIDIDEIAEENR